jgi:hypothetical protein
MGGDGEQGEQVELNDLMVIFRRRIKLSALGMRKGAVQVEGEEQLLDTWPLQRSMSVEKASWRASIVESDILEGQEASKGATCSSSAPNSDYHLQSPFA